MSLLVPACRTRGGDDDGDDVGDGDDGDDGGDGDDDDVFCLASRAAVVRLGSLVALVLTILGHAFCTSFRA